MWTTIRPRPVAPRPARDRIDDDDGQDQVEPSPMTPEVESALTTPIVAAAAVGEVGPLLWIVVVPLVLALLEAEREWTTFVVLLFATATATGYVALYGTPALQAAIATGVVWLLLFGGARAAAQSGTGDGSDAAQLAHDTLVPRILWKAVFVVVAIVCLWKGFRLLEP
jgi:hypothetical protein